MINNIKDLFQQVDDKPAFIYELSQHVEAKPNTIARHWLSNSGHWSIPERNQETVLTILQNWIKQQNDEQR